MMSRVIMMSWCYEYHFQLLKKISVYKIVLECNYFWKADCLFEYSCWQVTSYCIFVMGSDNLHCKQSTNVLWNKAIHCLRCRNKIIKGTLVELLSWVVRTTVKPQLSGLVGTGVNGPDNRKYEYWWAKTQMKSHSATANLNQSMLSKMYCISRYGALLNILFSTYQLHVVAE